MALLGESALRFVALAVLLTILNFVPSSSAAAAAALGDSNETWVVAARHLLERFVPLTHSRNVTLLSLQLPEFNVTPPLPGLVNDTFTVEGTAGLVEIRGTSGVALASGIYHYLKNAAGCLVTWGVNGTGDQLSLPPQLPDYPFTTVVSAVPLRYAWNMCTFSYSAAFWDEARWMREIDWLALHGVNYPLAFTGQEYVWWQLFRNSYNVSLTDLEPWFTGPAFLAWQRAGNIQRFAGPLTEDFLSGQMMLQRKILERMRSLGMTPILPCFAGHVPQVALKVWPAANFTKSTPWERPIPFPSEDTGVWYLDPVDPLFVEIGRAFLEAQDAIYGSNHYFNCDTFNEADPTSADPAYLRAASAAVHNSIAAFDTNGIWVMQAWLFHYPFWTSNVSLVEAYLSGVSNNRMLILDLNSEEKLLAPLFHQYYGKPWVWNLLHNYGGVRGMYGNLSEIANGPSGALREPGNTMVGIGFTAEAIEQNPVVYELHTDGFWTASSGVPSVSDWLSRYVVERYGDAAATGSPLSLGWDALHRAVYDQPCEPRSEIEWEPNWVNQSNFLRYNSRWIYGWQCGNSTGMLDAFRSFLTGASAIPDALANGPLLYDLVDIGRQAATMFFSDVHRQLTNEALRVFNPNSSDPLPRNSDTDNATRSMNRIGSLMLRVIAAIDRLLATNPNYLLGTWTSAARAWSNGTVADTANLLYNAKNQVTLWGPLGQINDYAAKGWAGLYSDYYQARWALMLSRMDAASAAGLGWDQSSYESELTALEVSWCENASAGYSSVPSGTSALAAARDLLLLLTNTSWASDAPVAEYVVLTAMDIPGHNFPVAPTWTTDIVVLSRLCELMDDCVGFTDDGYLKQGATSADAVAISEGGPTLYLKSQYLAPPPPSPSNASRHAGTIAGACIGGVVGIWLMGLVAHTIWVRHRKREGFHPLELDAADKEKYDSAMQTV